jgi:hypothetical protein
MNVLKFEMNMGALLVVIIIFINLEIYDNFMQNKLHLRVEKIIELKYSHHYLSSRE